MKKQIYLFILSNNKLTHENSENKGFFEGKTREKKKEEKFFPQSQRTGYMTFGKNGPIERSFICVFHTKKLTSVGPTPSAARGKISHFWGILLALLVGVVSLFFFNGLGLSFEGVF